MKRVFLFLLISASSVAGVGQIIADHKIVGKYRDIPQVYIDKVKSMWLVYAGESHSRAIRDGLLLLERLDSKYQANVTASGTPESYTDKHLRVSRATWGNFSNVSGWIYDYGEEDWFTNDTAVARTKAGIAYCNNNDLTISAIGFGWCYDMNYGSTRSSVVDPVFGCYWYGTSREGPDGNRCWGLDDEDNNITGNSVNMNTYLNATSQYLTFCKENNIPTAVFFSTGTVDDGYSDFTLEREYQGYLKNEYIRNFVKADTSRVLFDYADILCYDDNGSLATTSWNNISFPSITAINLGDTSIAHIGDNGALRLAKAMWWMLARIAGWDGKPSEDVVPVSGITVTGEGESSSISTYHGTLQLLAAVSPQNASDKTVTWSITSQTGQAVINSTGLVTSISDGTVVAKATANDGSGVSGEVIITISHQLIQVVEIGVTNEKESHFIGLEDGPVQFYALVKPDTASIKEVLWTVINYTGEAEISATGLLTPVAEGSVTVQASSTDGSEVIGLANIIIKGATVVSEIPDEEEMAIYIENGKLIIHIDQDCLPGNLRIYDLRGNLINGTPVKSDICIIDISQFFSGIYFMILRGSSDTKVKKFMIP